jgi:tripartite-type tricarboxylate transporter receptor subunit TctC
LSRLTYWGPVGGDGYTLVLGSNATHAIVPLLQKRPPYDPVKDFAPVGMVAITPTLLAVSNDLPVRKWKPSKRLPH